MNVMYTCDNNYIWLMGVSVISLFENNKHLADLTVFLLGENINSKNKKYLNEISNNYKRSIVIIDVPKLEIPKSLVSKRWPLSAFTRLYAGELLDKTVDRVLYLDCDTVVTGSIDQLSCMNLKDFTFYGVKDCVGKLYKQNIGLDGNDAYINAGVLLINVNKLRKLDVKGLIDAYMKKYEKLINYADQDILNGVFKKEIGVLSPVYDLMTIVSVYSYDEIKVLRAPTNYYSKQEIEESTSSPVIIHYTSNMRTIRPWYSNTNHPLAKVFDTYLKMSPWFDVELSEMQFYSRESKVIGIIQHLPKTMAVRLLGFIHTKVKPYVIRLMATHSLRIKGGLQ